MDARSFWFAVAAIAMPAGAAAQQPRLEQGNWNLTTHATTNGKAEPVQVQDECLRDELKDLAAYFSPSLEGVEAKCNRTPKKAAANAVAYKMRCTGNGFTMDAESEVTFLDPKTFTGMLKMDTKTTKERAVVVAKIAGKHTGACKP